MDGTKKMHGSGVAGSLRLLGAIAVLTLSVLAALTVLEVIPNDMFRQDGIKIASLLGIVALTTLVLTGLMWTRKRS